MGIFTIVLTTEKAKEKSDISLWQGLPLQHHRHNTYSTEGVLPAPLPTRSYFFTQILLGTCEAPCTAGSGLEEPSMCLPLGMFGACRMD